jgi:hypothetical protein
MYTRFNSRNDYRRKINPFTSQLVCFMQARKICVTLPFDLVLNTLQVIT